MRKSTKISLALLSVLSPLWVGVIVYNIINPPENSLIALAVLMGVILGSPVIAFAGLVASFLTRKSTRANLFFVLGFVVPAIVACLYEVIVMTGG